MKKTSFALISAWLLFPNHGNGQTFQTLGSGLRITGTVRVLEFDSIGNRIFAAGHFSQIDETEAANIAWKDAQGWHAFGTGVQGYVSSLKYVNGKLYVAGNFSSIDGVPMASIGYWDGLAWHAMDGGVDGSINSMAWYNSSLWVSGYFLYAGGQPANHIARWDGNQWHPVGPGSDEPMVYLRVLKDTLFAWGNFKNFNGMAANRIVAFDGVTWTSLPIGNAGLALVVMLNYQNKIYVVAFNQPAQHYNMFYLDGGAWINSGFAHKAIGSSFFVYHDSLYFFTRKAGGGGDTVFMHKLITTSITDTIGYTSEDGTSLDLSIDNVIQYKDTVYLCGMFRNFKGQFAAGIAAYHNHVFSAPFYTSVGYSDEWYHSFGISLLFDSAQNELIAGGCFDFAGKILSHNVARWDGLEWKSMGEGLSGDIDRVYVRKVIKYKGQIYAGGRFERAGNTIVNNIARWDGQYWQPLGLGVNDWVRDMEVYNNELYIVGYFTSVDSGPMEGIVKYDGSAFAAVPGLTGNGPVETLCIHSGKLLVSGHIVLGGNNVRIASFDGVQWTVVPYGNVNSAFSLHSHNGNLYASTEYNVYVFTGSSWTQAGYSCTGMWPGYFYLSSFNNHLVIGDNAGNNTSMTSGTGAYELFCYNVLYEVVTAGPATAYVTGFLPNVFFNGHVINHIAMIKEEPPSTAFLASPDTLCDHQYVFFNASNTDFIQSYEWSFPGGTPSASTAFSPVIKYNNPGNYDVFLKQPMLSAVIRSTLPI